MVRSFVAPSPRRASLKELPPSSPETIRKLAEVAGLNLSESLLGELCASYPAFEAMVRRLPRDAEIFDDPAHVFDAELAAGTRVTQRNRSDAKDLERKG